MTNNPYATKASHHFWKPAVGACAPIEIRPVPAKRFRLTAHDRIATAGSCFAQHLSKHLKTRGPGRFLQTEPTGPGQPPFSALYGNIYTARQLVQLADEAFGARQPREIAWRRPDGRYVDALRPSVFEQGFADPAAVRAARQAHLGAVRALLSDCTVFVFTLGLTEAWVSDRDCTVYPLAPGVAAEPADPEDYRFHNFTYEEVRDDLERFAEFVLRANPHLRLLLTVSPVPLTATYTDEHVLVATAHSKAILRAVCSAVTAKCDHVYYFPSYEIIAGHHTRGAYFADNLRTVKEEGVAHVMTVFEETYGQEEMPAARAHSAPAPAGLFSKSDENVLCDEADIVKTLGFE